jgi:hypothetical protein
VEAAGEALAQKDAGKRGDQDRAGVDQKRRRARVDAPFGRVQRDAVERQEEHPVRPDLHQVAP